MAHPSQPAAKDPLAAASLPPGRKRKPRRLPAAQAGPANLQQEIAIVRTTIRRVFDLIESEDFALDELCRALNTLADASSRLALLLEAQRTLAAAAQDLTGPLNTSITEIIQESGGLI